MKQCNGVNVSKVMLTCIVGLLCEIVSSTSMHGYGKIKFSLYLFIYLFIMCRNMQCFM